MTRHIMLAEIFIKNRLEALLKPVMGINRGRNAPRILTDDIDHCLQWHEST